MATNDFLVFSGGAGSSSNTMTQANYASNSARISGVVPGVADPLLANKAWRQPSIIAAMIGQFIADYSGQNAIDDGTTSALETNFVLAINSILNSRPVLSETGSGNNFVISPSPSLISRSEGQVLRFKASHSNSGASTVNDGIGSAPLVGLSQSALQGGEIVSNGEAWIQWNSSVGGSGSYVLLFCTGSPMQVANGTQTQHAVTLGQITGGNLNLQGGSLGLTGRQLMTGGYGSVPSAASNLVIGGGGTGSNAASIAWGDGSGWKLNLGRNASGSLNTLFSFTDTGRLLVGTSDDGSGALLQTGSPASVGNATANQHAVALGQMNTALSSKANSATTLAGYGITDAVSQAQITSATLAVQSLSPSQFDNSARAATTSFLKSFGLQFKNNNQVSTNTTLVAANLNQFFQVNPSSSGVTINLPLSSTCPNGQVVGFLNTSIYPVTIQKQTGDNIFTTLNLASVLLRPGDSAIFETDASGNWFLFGGSAQLAYLPSNGIFGGSTSSNGWSQSPNGTIYQWGSATVNANNSPTTITLPTTFPNACLQTYAQYGGAPPGANSCGSAPVTTSTINVYQNYTSSQLVRWWAVGY
ncbi:hypothetical protein JOS77_29215 [Chromobacterium haemolyticum]|nr:hypothetical protein JOS77_29215 [Chromobacterium haemolyticum]